MIRFLTAALAGLAFLVPATLASAQPMALSPDVNDPWLVQLFPGQQRPAFTPPRTTRFFLFGNPANRTPTTLAPQPAQLRAPGGASQGRQIDPRFLPQTVAYATKEKPGTIRKVCPCRKHSRASGYTTSRDCWSRLVPIW
jgi:hypothetical protein